MTLKYWTTIDFSPNSESFFNHSLRFGSSGIVSAKNNPTKRLKDSGHYYPIMTLFKAIRRSGIEYFLHVQFSAPKMIFKNNFDEVQESDFGDICWLLKERMYEMGVLVDNVKNIENAEVTAIHYSKNIVLDDGKIPYQIIKELQKTNISKIFDTNKSDYRNEGQAFKYHTNSFEFIVYDKIKDLQQSSLNDPIEDVLKKIIMFNKAYWTVKTKKETL